MYLYAMYVPVPCQLFLNNKQTWNLAQIRAIKGKYAKIRVIKPKYSQI